LVRLGTFAAADCLLLLDRCGAYVRYVRLIHALCGRWERRRDGGGGGKRAEEHQVVCIFGLVGRDRVAAGEVLLGKCWLATDDGRWWWGGSSGPPKAVWRLDVCNGSDARSQMPHETTTASDGAKGGDSARR
jgi:hypothetical protein